MEETLLFLMKKRKNKVDQMNEYYGEKYNDEGYLFCYQDGQPFKNYNISDRFAYRRDKLNLSKDIHFHCLRHTFATMFLERTNDMKTLQYLLGHSTYDMTANIYSHVTDEMKKKSRRVSEAINELLFVK